MLASTRRWGALASDARFLGLGVKGSVQCACGVRCVYLGIRAELSVHRVAVTSVRGAVTL